MITALIIVAIVIGYVFTGSALGFRHNAVASSKCGGRNHWEEYSWCQHCYISLWVFGIFWPVGLPVAAGALVGSSTKETRAEKRRASELAEAQHKAEVARLLRIEDEELSRQLKAKPLR